MVFGGGYRWFAHRADGTITTVVYGGECRWSARRADDTEIAGLKRWCMAVGNDRPRTAPTMPSRRWWKAVDADGLCEAGHASASPLGGYPS